MAKPAPLGPGDILKARWRLGERLGEGAFGEVFEVTDVKDPTASYAIKVAVLQGKKRAKSSQSVNARLLFKERSLYQLTFKGKHPCIATVPNGGYGQDKGYRFLVMQKLGDSLRGMMKKHGAFSPANMALVATQAISALKFVHEKRYVYRDIKPDNFMIGSGANTNTCYLIDFGCAERDRQHDGSLPDPKENGTPTYFSLNTHDGKPATHRDDLEGLGYMLVELMLGELPWQKAKSDAELVRMKRGADIPSLCEGLPDCLELYLQRVRALDIGDAIEYDRLGGLFEDLVPGDRAFVWGRGAGKGASKGRSQKGRKTAAAAAPTTKAKRKTKGKTAARRSRTQATAAAQAASDSDDVHIESESDTNEPEPQPKPTRRARSRARGRKALPPRSSTRKSPRLRSESPVARRARLAKEAWDSSQQEDEVAVASATVAAPKRRGRARRAAVSEPAAERDESPVTRRARASNSRAKTARRRTRGRKRSPEVVVVEDTSDDDIDIEAKNDEAGDVPATPSPTKRPRRTASSDDGSDSDSTSGSAGTDGLATPSAARRTTAVSPLSPQTPGAAAAAASSPADRRTYNLRTRKVVVGVGTAVAGALAGCLLPAALNMVQAGAW